MARTGSAGEMTREQAFAVDRRINRAIGIVVLLVGAIFIYSLVFSPFDQKVRFQWEVTPDGGRVPRTHITCPSPWAVLVHEAEPEMNTSEGLCVMPSRVLVVEGTIVAMISIIIATWLFTRKARPRPIHELPFSKDNDQRGVIS